MEGRSIVRKSMLVLCVTMLLLGLTPTVAEAAEICNWRTGYGTVSTRCWTRNWKTVTFLGEHRGSRATVKARVECENGWTYNNRWVDTGPRFRLMVRDLPRRTRCWEYLRVEAASPDTEVHVEIWMGWA